MSPHSRQRGRREHARDPQVSDADLDASWQLLRQAVHHLDVDLAAALRSQEVDQRPEYEALAHLLAAPDRMISMSELAGRIGMSSGGMTKIADRLVRDRMITRQPSIRDRRVIYAVLTDFGAAAVTRTSPAYAAALRAALGELDADTVATMTSFAEHLLHTPHPHPDEVMNHSATPAWPAAARQHRASTPAQPTRHTARTSRYPTTS